MTSTVPESQSHEPGSADPESTETGATSHKVGRERSWIRTLLVAAAAVGILMTVALLATTGDSNTAAGTDAAAEAGDPTEAGETGTSPADEGIFALPFTTADGGTSTLSAYRGEPLVVNFFASWCPPCRAELPDFEAAHQNLGDEVTFIGVNQDFTEETWKAFINETQVSYETVFQPQSEIWTEIGTQAMPTTVFIAADGTVQQVWAGLITGEKLEDVINDSLLNGTP